ncbi:MAG: hypothetical protein HYV96_16200 [Opitutae bacterium]|nr:hypothetical protein [Opitutae bacterium]
MKPKTENQEWDTVSVELPVRYWVVALGAIDGFVKQTVQPLIAEARKKGLSEKEMPIEHRTIVAGGLSSRAAIVSALVKAGAMTPQSEESTGLSSLKKMQERGKRARDERDSSRN